jgi:hypothetical protein
MHGIATAARLARASAAVSSAGSAAVSSAGSAGVSSAGVGAVCAGESMHLSELAVGGGVPPPAGIAVETHGRVPSLEHRLAHRRRIQPPGSGSSVATKVPSHAPRPTCRHTAVIQP